MGIRLAHSGCMMKAFIIILVIVFAAIYFLDKGVI